MGVRQSATILFPDTNENRSEKAGKLKTATSGKIFEMGQKHILMHFLEKEIDTGAVEDEKQESLDDLPSHLKIGKDFTMRVTVLQAYGLASEYSDVFTQFK